MDIKFGQLKPPQKTYFFERKNGTIFTCEVGEADMMKRNYKLVGVSDGTQYYQEVSKAQEESRKRVALANGKLKNKEIAQTEHDLEIEEIDKDYQNRVMEIYEKEKEIAIGHLEKIPDTTFMGENGATMNDIINLRF
jgi:hypothetical protein